MLIAVIAILLLCALGGYRRGFVRVMFSLLSFVVASTLCSVLSPYVSAFLVQKTPLHGHIQSSCARIFQEQQQQMAGEAAGQISEQPPGGGSFDMLPDVMKDALAKGSQEKMAELVDASKMAEYIGGYLADVIIRGISFTLTFLLVFFLLQLLIHALDLITKLPVLHAANKLGGAAAGLLEGLLVVWLGFFLVTLCIGNEMGNSLMGQIRDNTFLSFLYDNNILLPFAMGFFQF